MTANCEWFDSQLDAYFEQSLQGGALNQFDQHRASCPDCREKLQVLDRELSSADPLSRQVLHYRLAQARTAATWNAKPRVLKLAFAGSGVALAAVIGVGLLMPGQTAPPPQIAVETPAPVAPQPAPIPKTDKIENPTGGIQRAKPDAGVAANAQGVVESRPAVGDNADFAIIDAAGYSASLETYRGKVLLFAVVSADHAEAVSQLQQLYQTFGANPGLRVLGIPTRRDAKLAGATFPVFYNQGSKLLGVEAGDFLLLDTNGAAKLSGTLTEGNAARIRSQLGQLGIE